MIDSCLSAFRRDRSRFEFDPRAFIETYLETRRRAGAMRNNLNRVVAVAGVGALMAVIASLAVFSIRLFLVDRQDSALEPPAEIAPDAV
jgi:hypothetical protein